LLITGDVGSGKTTICRKVISDLHSGIYKVFYVSLTTGNVVERHFFNHLRIGLDMLAISATQMPGFSKTGERSKKRESVFSKLKKFFQRFFDISKKEL